MGFKTDLLPFPLSVEATRIRAMATRNRTAQAAEEDQGLIADANGNGADHGNQDILQALLREMREQNQMRQQPRNDLEVFKAPEYNGLGSIEVFIKQFSDVADANAWTRGAALLHLRRALKDEARDCGAGDEVEEIFEALRARFGISPREARSKLSNIRKEYKTSLQEHATTIKELMRIAYPDLPGGLQVEMGLDYFVNSLHNSALQRHLLAIRPDTIAAAVAAGNEYLQVKTGSTSFKQLEGEGQEEEWTQVMPIQENPVTALAHRTASPMPAQQAWSNQPVQSGVTQSALAGSVLPAQGVTMPSWPNQPVQSGVTQPALAASTLPGQYNPHQMDPMAMLMTAMAELANEMGAMRAMMGGSGGPRRKLACYKCGQEGHIQRN